MSYQVLARKWRPQGFDDVTGQSHVTTPLRNAIRGNRVPHAILFTGPRGVGKTTLARILARSLNCEKGPTDTPCGECPTCLEITSGHSTDVQEIDAASRTSVDDVRELIESIRYAAAPGKYRIFVVDEVHMLSTAAFNALLKTLEEPPPNSLFVFATTNPEKIPFTVVSRCQRYDLRRLTASEISERLRHISGAEGIDISDKSLLAIAREADGSMRDAQTLLDQLIAFGGGSIGDDQVAEVLDLIDRRLLLAIVEACVDGDAAAALEACGRAGASGADAKRIGENLLQLLRDLVVLRLAPDTHSLIEASEDEIAELRALAERSELARLRRMFRALLKEQEDLAWAPQPMAVLEMAAVRLATMPAGDDVATLLSRLDALERSLSGGNTSGGGPAGAGGGPAASGGGPAARSRGAAAKARGASAAPATNPSPDSRPKTPAPRDEPAPPPTPAPQGADLDAPPAVIYDRLRGFVRENHPGLFAALEGGRLLVRDAERLRLRVPTRFSAQRLEDRRQSLAEACERFFGTPLQIEIESADAAPAGTGETASGGGGKVDPEFARSRRQNALNHPGVNAALELLDGEIVEIRPFGEGR